MAEKCEQTKGGRSCPYCDEEIAEAAFPYCEACGKEIISCPSCKEPVSNDAKVCPNCGVDIEVTTA